MTWYPTWPWRLLWPQKEAWYRKASVVQGGPSISGIEQAVVSSGGGFWVATLTGFKLFSPDQVKAWRAFEAMLDDGATTIIVPKPDLNFAPRPMAGGCLQNPGCPEAAAPGDWFDWHPGLGSQMMAAHNVGAQALRATQIVIEVDAGGQLQAGQFFSINHATKGWRLYVVQQVVSVSGRQSTVNIRPPLRDVVSDAQAIELDTPRCLMRLQPGTAEKAVATVELGRAAEASITFEEAF